MRTLATGTADDVQSLWGAMLSFEAQARERPPQRRVITFPSDEEEEGEENA